MSEAAFRLPTEAAFRLRLESHTAEPAPGAAYSGAHNARVHISRHGSITIGGAVNDQAQLLSSSAHALAMSDFEGDAKSSLDDDDAQSTGSALSEHAERRFVALIQKQKALLSRQEEQLRAIHVPAPRALELPIVSDAFEREIDAGRALAAQLRDELRSVTASERAAHHALETVRVQHAGELADRITTAEIAAAERADRAARSDSAAAVAALREEQQDAIMLLRRLETQLASTARARMDAERRARENGAKLAAARAAEQTLERTSGERATALLRGAEETAARATDLAAERARSAAQRALAAVRADFATQLKESEAARGGDTRRALDAWRADAEAATARALGVLRDEHAAELSALRAESAAAATTYTAEERAPSPARSARFAAPLAPDAAVSVGPAANAALPGATRERARLREAMGVIEGLRSELRTETREAEERNAARQAALIAAAEHERDALRTVQAAHEAALANITTLRAQERERLARDASTRDALVVAHECSAARAEAAVAREQRAARLAAAQHEARAKGTRAQLESQARQQLAAARWCQRLAEGAGVVVFISILDLAESWTELCYETSRTKG